MDLPADVKKQLMQMAGITDPKEFDQMAEKIAGKATQAAASSNNSTPKPPQQSRQSPFQVHFVKLMALIELQSEISFESQNDLKAQIQEVYNILNSDPDYHDMKTFIAKYFTKEEKSAKERAEMSLLIRDRGNKAYAKKEMDTALLHFSQSSLMAPIDALGKGREVAVALANRSAVHFELENWQRCLDDINASFMFGYPSELVFKLFERRGRCYMKLSRFDEAVKAFEAALLKVEESKLEAKKRETFVIEAKKKLIEVKAKISTDKKSVEIAKEDEEEDWRKCPFEMWDRNPIFPPLSDALGIAFNDEGGRHVIATRNIIAGEPVVIEEPVSAHLSPCFMPANCIHCLRRNGHSVLPSPLNARARFCSFGCLEIAMKSYHVIESKIDINQLFYSNDIESGQMSGCISLAYRAITQKNLQFFLQNKDRLFGHHDIKFGIDMPQKFSYTGDEHYRGLFNLVNHSGALSSSERQGFVLRTVVLLKCLQGSDYFPTKAESQLSQEELYIGQLLFHFQTGIQYNLHAVYQVHEKELVPGKRIPLTDIGAGCYPTTIFFNHSCAPNTVRINQGKRVVYVAKRNIAKGDQVTDCYGIHHLYMKREERQGALKKGYVFECTCEACLKSFGTLAALPATLPPNIAVKLGNTMSKYKEQFEKGKLQKALQCCQEYLGKMEVLNIPFPHRNYEISAIALCSCLWAIATKKNG